MDLKQCKPDLEPIDKPDISKGKCVRGRAPHEKVVGQTELPVTIPVLVGFAEGSSADETRTRPFITVQSASRTHRKNVQADGGSIEKNDSRHRRKNESLREGGDGVAVKFDVSTAVNARSEVQLKEHGKRRVHITWEEALQAERERQIARQVRDRSLPESSIFELIAKSLPTSNPLKLIAASFSRELPKLKGAPLRLLSKVSASRR